MTENERAALAAIIRWVLVLVTAPLVTHKIIDAKLLDAALGDLTTLLIGVLLSGAVLAWSLLQKKAASVKLEIASQLPAGSTAADATEVLKQTSPGLAKVP